MKVHLNLFGSPDKMALTHCLTSLVFAFRPSRCLHTPTPEKPQHLCHPSHAAAVSPRHCPVPRVVWEEAIHFQQLLALILQVPPGTHTAWIRYLEDTCPHPEKQTRQCELGGRSGVAEAEAALRHFIPCWIPEILFALCKQRAKNPAAYFRRLQVMFKSRSHLHVCPIPTVPASLLLGLPG